MSSPWERRIRVPYTERFFIAQQFGEYAGFGPDAGGQALRARMPADQMGHRDPNVTSHHQYWGVIALPLHTHRGRLDSGFNLSGRQDGEVTTD